MLSKIKEEAYLNAYRLFKDSALLWLAGRYPSSYAMSILAMEEAGKLHMLDWMCDVIGQDPDRMRETIQFIFSKDMALSHRKKQEFAVRETLHINRGKDPFFEQVKSGQLDRTKQDAIYVGLRGDEIVLPRKTTKQAARAQIKRSFRMLADIDDLGFNGFTVPLALPLSSVRGTISNACTS